MPVNKFFAEGGCACGEVRFVLQSAPLFVHCCHCRWCQRETGSAFVLNAMIESGRLELLQGAPQTVVTPSESGKGQKIVRCPECSVAVWSHYPGMGEKVSFIRVGTLDDPDLAPPDIHIYTESKQPWLALSENIPAVRQYYRKSDYWPEESIARFNAVKGS